jgi:hypothetical protein
MVFDFSNAIKYKKSKGKAKTINYIKYVFSQGKLFLKFTCRRSMR